MDFIETAGVNGRRLPKHRCNNRAPSSSPDTSLQTNLTSRIAAESRSDLPNTIGCKVFHSGWDTQYLFPWSIRQHLRNAQARRQVTKESQSRLTVSADRAGHVRSDLSRVSQ